jgi:hypothetical protein
VRRRGALTTLWEGDDGGVECSATWPSTRWSAKIKIDKVEPI